VSARLIWCRHPGCQIGYATTEHVPDTCPACGQPAHWTTDPPIPLEPYTLTLFDRGMLKSLRISAA
jgi:hypothetical protein